MTAVQRHSPAREHARTRAPLHPVGYRSILCPVDFSASSARALRFAHALAHRWGSRLTLLYTVDPMLASSAAVALVEESLVDRAEEGMREFLRNAIGREQDTVRTTCVTRIGRTAGEIFGMVNRVGADLIVMSTHGMTGAKRLFIGSTTRAVLHRASVPVLVIPRLEPHQEPSEVDSTWPGERIVAALDLNTRSRRVATAAAEIATWFGAMLVLLHVVEQVYAPEWLEHALSAHDRIRIGKARADMGLIVRQISASYPRVEGRVVCGNVADEVAALATAENAGLVITALDRGAGLLPSSRGSVSYHVLTHAVAPVLALPRL